MKDVKVFLANLPHLPGVYQMLGKNREVLYVGKARDLKKRLASYFNGSSKDLKTASLLKHVDDIDITITHSENDAFLLECNLIKKHQPYYNVLLRDDKSYPYITITSEHPFPRIDIYRGTRKRKGLYFGPYPSGYAVRETIHLLQKVFLLRTCEDSFFKGRSRPCLLHQIGRCTGPCVGLISAEQYNENVKLAILFLQGKSQSVINALQKQMEAAAEQLNYELATQLRDQIARLRQIQEKQYIDSGHANADVIGFAMQAGLFCLQLLSIRDGRVLGSRSYFPSVPPHSSREEIISAFITQHYLAHKEQMENIAKEIILAEPLADEETLAQVLSEQAKHKVILQHPVRGDRKKWLEMATTSAKQSLASRLFHKTNIQERFLSLEEKLELDHLPQRIECFDISHSQGEATVASCVVFDRNGPVKNLYRRFNITGITPGDDTSAMRQVIYRRFKRMQKEEGSLPDIVFIDGGQGQLNAARMALAELGIENIQLIGIAKGALRKPGLETLYRADKPPLHLPPDTQALHLIQQIRDEAHRFAITGHRARRAKKRSQSVLESIPGIGAQRRRELLRFFGGIQGVSHASLEELSKVPGISRALAERIFTALHDATT